MDPEVEKIHSSPGLPSQGAQQERTIFIIHGFHLSTFRYYRGVLEQWVLEKAREVNAPVTVYLLRFDAPGVPSQGKVVLERAVWKLRRFLLKKALQDLTDDDIQDQGPQDDHSVQDDNSIANESPPSRNRRITFVAHGLGSWIVKDVLAHPKMDSIRYAYAIIDIKFLDASVHREADDGYRKYLERNWTTFGFGSPKHQKGATFDQLVSYLWEIDDNFDTFANTHIAEVCHVTQDEPRPPTIYKDPDHPVWMSQGLQVVLNHNEQTGGERLSFSRLLVGAQPSVRHAPMIGELPSSIEASQRFPSHLHQPGISQPGGPPGPPTILLDPIDDTNSPYPPLRAHMKNQGRLTPELPSPYPRKEDDEGPVDNVSIPDRDFIPMSSGHIQSTCKLANMFLQKGELHNAGVLFEKVLAHTSSQDQSGTEMVWIHMQVAAVKIYRGYYQAGMQDLQDIKEWLQTTNIAETQFWHLIYHCERWMATCQLYAGRWRDAADQMETLLKNDPMRYHIRLHRDQGLAYAYLGQYGKARSCLDLAKKRAETAESAAPNWEIIQRTPSAAEHGTISTSKNDGHETEQSATSAKAERDRRAKENSLKAAEARIDILAGDYPAALKHSSEALNYLRTTVGSKHFRTLATATLKAWSLAYDGKYNEAETLCSTTWKATKAALGRNHPQTLEAIGCLIYVYRSQGRFAEAVGTGMSATSISSHGHEDIRDHPEHLHVEFQLALSFLANGDYAESRATFSKLVPRAENVMGEGHPETLRYKAEQARVLLNLGSITEARNLASYVAIRQFQVYDQITTQDTRIANASASVLRSQDSASLIPLPRLAELLRIAAGSLLSPKPLHPFLLSTLQLAAKVQIRKFQLSGSYKDEEGLNSDLATAQRILHYLHDYFIEREESQAPTDNNTGRLSSASTALDLATLLKEQPPNFQFEQQKLESQQTDPLAHAVEFYSYAHNALKQTLDENDLSTLLAQRDLTIAKTLRSSPDPQTSFDYLQQVKNVSDCLYKKLESRLGVLHPETLTMRLWCFTIDLLLASSPGSGPVFQKNIPGIESEWEEIDGNLRDPCVVEQRLVESLAMRRQLAGLLSGTGRTEQALKVVEGALADLDRRIIVLDTIPRGEDQREEEKFVSGGEEGEFGDEGLRETLEGLRTSFEGIRDDCVSSTGSIGGQNST